MSRRILSIDDLADDEVDALLAAATELADGRRSEAPARNVALLFFEASLRTRTGFIAATHRLGWPTPVEIVERRASNSARPESLQDTVAVASGYFDTLIVRHDVPITEVVPFVTPEVAVLNAGDGGPTPEHPSQALIDVFATSRLVGAVDELRVVVAGDLRMRSSRSLLKLFARRPPAELVVVTDASLAEGLDLPPALGAVRTVESYDQLDGIDALHAVGIPHGTAVEEVRARLRVDAVALGRLSPRGRVFSPMPVFDEVDRGVRGDTRLAFLEQSALALHVRTALLEALSAWGGAGRGNG